MNEESILLFFFLYMIDLLFKSMAVIGNENKFSLEKAENKNRYAWILLFWIFPLAWVITSAIAIAKYIRKQVSLFKNLPEL